MSTNPQPSAVPQRRIGWLGVAGIVTGVLLAVVQALVWSAGVVSNEVEGYAAAGILIPLLIAYAIAGRKAKRNWDQFGLCFAGLALFFLLLEISGRLQATGH
jgi:ABC-type Fe3+-siderophore transport system permease subunit